jgi:hypothetical protein
MVTRRKERRKLRRSERTPVAAVRVNVEALAPYNSYGAPKFVMRGYYEDVPFQCAGCGAEQVWTASQQKWWYEVAKGYVYSSAKLCRACRQRERLRSAESRRVHLAGIARKKTRTA